MRASASSPLAQDVRRLNRNWGEVKVPKVGWVRLRWSRTDPQNAKSFRVTLDRAGRWHVAFAVIPGPVPGPGTARETARRKDWAEKASTDLARRLDVIRVEALPRNLEPQLTLLPA